MTVKNDHVPSSIQRVPELGETHSLTAPLDVQDVHQFLKSLLKKSASADGDKTFSENLKEARAAHKAELEKSIKESREKLANAESGIQELEHTKDTLGEWATKVDEAETELKGSEEHALLLDEKVF